MIADQGDKLSRRVLGDTLQAATLRLMLILVAVAAVLATITWLLRP